MPHPKVCLAFSGIPSPSDPRTLPTRSCHRISCWPSQKNPPRTECFVLQGRKGLLGVGGKESLPKAHIRGVPSPQPPLWAHTQTYRLCFLTQASGRLLVWPGILWGAGFCGPYLALHCLAVRSLWAALLAWQTQSCFSLTFP